jgi:ABC-2 type transport system ATP-binding protein
VVRTADGAASDRALRRALAAEEVLVREAPDGGLLTEADPEVVGRAALRGGVALLELRPAGDGASLEQLFFQLTTDRTEYHAELPELQETAR